MISYKVLISILVIHWLADFALQTHEQATQKSSDNVALLKHVLTYCFVWIWGAWFLLDNSKHIPGFVLVTGLFHYGTDWCTSRLAKQCFEVNDYHNGFVIIGADQVLHYVQLFTTYYLLT